MNYQAPTCAASRGGICNWSLVLSEALERMNGTWHGEHSLAELMRARLNRRQQEMATAAMKQWFDEHPRDWDFDLCSLPSELVAVMWADRGPYEDRSLLLAIPVGKKFGQC